MASNEAQYESWCEEYAMDPTDPYAQREWLDMTPDALRDITTPDSAQTIIQVDGISTFEVAARAALAKANGVRQWYTEHAEAVATDTGWKFYF